MDMVFGFMMPALDMNSDEIYVESLLRITLCTVEYHIRYRIC